MYSKNYDYVWFNFCKVLLLQKSRKSTKPVEPEAIFLEVCFRVV